VCVLLLLQVTLAEYGLGAIALYYLTPALLGGFVGSLRGFAGEVTAAQALDLLASDGSAVLIDIRTEVRRGGLVGLCDSAAAAAAQQRVLSTLHQKLPLHFSRRPILPAA
jgi:hypothetical protein